MALEIKLAQKLSQSLLMTPQLQQAIKLLQLGRLEYKEAIEKELLENPVLEEVKEIEEPDISAATTANGEGEASQLDEKQIDWERYLTDFSENRGTTSTRGTVDFDELPSYDSSLTKETSLIDHITEQLRMVDLENINREILLHVVGNLNAHGYLQVTCEEIIAACNTDRGTVDKVLEVVQGLEPPGVGARNLKECLLLQLDRLGLTNGLASKIISQYLEQLQGRKYDFIAKAEKIAVEDVYSAVTTIQGLEPRPGRPFASDTTRYVVPDIYVYKVGNQWEISLNEDGLPKLRVSPYYLQLLRGKKESGKTDRDYLTERLKAASWLIKSIHQRQNTIYRVTESIVKFQKEFLEQGVEKLRPLVLKDVADEIEMHESTVSRVTTNKYVHTPQGVFELKYFFTSGIKTTNGNVSSSSIKEKIKNIIAAEAPKKPISDQKIVDLLATEDIQIARRTVAKYRESLGILSSSKRKKLF